MHRCPRLIHLIIIEYLGVRVDDFYVRPNWEGWTSSVNEIGNPNNLRHGVGVISATIEDLKPQAGPVRMRVFSDAGRAAAMEFTQLGYRERSYPQVVADCLRPPTTL